MGLRQHSLSMKNCGTNSSENASVTPPSGEVWAASLPLACVFPVQLQIFPAPIYVICDYYIHKTDLADLSKFQKKMKFWGQILKYLLPLE